MGLILERHPSDIIKTAKIKIVIDKKLKYRKPYDVGDIHIRRNRRT